MKTVVGAIVLILFAGNVIAAEITWMYVQHRKYETGRNLNRLAFGLINDKGQAAAEASDVADVKLFAPDGSAVNLLKYRFDSDEEIFGIYDALKSQWFYTDFWQFDSWFRANFVEPLVPGRYQLRVTTPGGEVVKSSFHFKKHTELPVVSSSSFRIYDDSEGNVIWKWDIPDDLGRLAFNLHTEARASIDIMKNNKNVAYFFVKIPSHMGYVFIPRHIVEKITSRGDQFGFRIQLATKDKNNRTYSGTVITNQLLQVKTW